MLVNYLHQLDESLDDDTDVAIQDQILLYASENRDAFIEEVHKLPPDQFDKLNDIYEVLADDPSPWADFFLNEIDRLLTLARKSSDPEPIIQPLDAFWLISLNEDAVELRQDLLHSFFSNLDDEIAIIRRRCVVLTGDLVSKKDFKELDKLEEMVKKDPDWRVRYLAHQALEDIHPKRAKRTKLPRWIRLRARASNIDFE
jgi:hypothetical protein